MNWDWEKLQGQRRRQGYQPPEPGEIHDRLKRFSNLRFPGGGKLIILLLVVLWGLSGFYIVQPDERGVEKRFGKFTQITDPGPHIHWPFPIESVHKPKVSEIKRVEVGFRSVARNGTLQPGQYRLVPEESLMLTGDENIVDVQFIVQYQISDPVAYLFNVAEQENTVKYVAQATMREVVGNSVIDSALTTGKFVIQTQTRDLMQEVLDRYQAGVRVIAVQLQDVHPPKEVVDAFKDVASAREDKSRLINEAEAYRNDILPKARGQVAVIVNEAQAYKESQVLDARGGAEKFLAVLTEYRKAKDVTRQRMYLESMERIFSSSGLEKIILSGQTAGNVVPYLPLDKAAPRPKQDAAGGAGGKQ
ncbi:MAG: FtsH protease activity modulator HflK [Desulfocurvibacter africanus]